MLEDEREDRNLGRATCLACMAAHPGKSKELEEAKRKLSHMKKMYEMAVGGLISLLAEIEENENDGQ